MELDVHKVKKDTVLNHKGNPTSEFIKIVDVVGLDALDENGNIFNYIYYRFKRFDSVRKEWSMATHSMHSSDLENYELADENLIIPFNPSRVNRLDMVF